MGKSFLSYKELETLLCDVEAVINSRPLVYVSEEDLNESLTPYHLIYGRNIFQKRFQNIPKDLKSLSRRVKYLQTLIRQQHLYQKSKNISEKLMVGDIVLIYDDKRIPRNQWRLGKVEELIISKDGNIRGAKLVVVSKSRSRSICYCPIKKFILRLFTNQKNRQIKRKMEVNEDKVEADKGHNSDIKSTRKAAIEGQYNRRLRDKYDDRSTREDVKTEN